MKGSSSLMRAWFVKFGSSPLTRTYALSIFFCGFTLNGSPVYPAGMIGYPSCDSSRSPVVINVCPASPGFKLKSPINTVGNPSD